MAVTTEDMLMNDLISERAKLHGQKKKAEAKVNEIKKALAALDVILEERLEAEELPGAAGDKGSIKRFEQDIYIIEDYEKLWAYAKRTNRPELFQKRLSSTVVAELLANPRIKNVPGIGTMTKTGIRFSPKKGK